MRLTTIQVFDGAGLGVWRALLLIFFTLAIHGGGRADEVSIDVHGRVEPMQPFKVDWHGPDASGDFISIAPPGTSPASFLAYARTSRGNPASLDAPEAGEYEVRYISAAGLRILATAPLSVAPPGTGADVELMALLAVDRGSPFHVAWTGAAAEGDRIAVLPAASSPDETVTSQPVDAGSPLDLVAPKEAGNYEIVYIAGHSGAVLARRALEVR